MDPGLDKFTRDVLLTLETRKIIVEKNKCLVIIIIDITLIDRNKKETYLIDIAIPNDTNIIQKEQGKITKYTPLANKI